jgi:hypothetical protein
MVVGIPSFRRRDVWLGLVGWFANEPDNADKYLKHRHDVFGDQLPSTLYIYPLFGSESLLFAVYSCGVRCICECLPPIDASLVFVVVGVCVNEGEFDHVSTTAVCACCIQCQCGLLSHACGLWYVSLSLSVCLSVCLAIRHVFGESTCSHM